MDDPAKDILDAAAWADRVIELVCERGPGKDTVTATDGPEPTWEALPGRVWTLQHDLHVLATFKDRNTSREVRQMFNRTREGSEDAGRAIATFLRGGGAPAGAEPLAQ